MFDYSVFYDLVDNDEESIVLLSPETHQIIEHCLTGLGHWQFKNGGSILSPSERDDISAVFANAIHEINSPVDPLDYVPVVQSFFDHEVEPTTNGNSSGAAGSVGVRFIPAVNGVITSVMFPRYPGYANTQTGRLYSNTGTLLGSANFPAGGFGWTRAEFATPIAVTAGTKYVAAVFASNTVYRVFAPFYSSAHVVGDLTAPADIPAGERNGVFVLNATPSFPSTGASAITFRVDVEFIADV